MNVAFLTLPAVLFALFLIIGFSIWVGAVSHARWGAKNEAEQEEDYKAAKFFGRIFLTGLVGSLSIFLWNAWSLQDSKVSYKALPVNRVSKQGRLYDVANWNGTDINLNDRFGYVFEDDAVVFVKSRVSSWGLTYSDELVTGIDE